MPNKGPMHPGSPIEVLVRQDNGWDVGLMREWRWADEERGVWEGRVDTGIGRYEWIPGHLLRRVGPPSA